MKTFWKHVSQRHAAGDRRVSRHFIGVFTGSPLIGSHVRQRPGPAVMKEPVSRDYPVMFGTLYIFTLIGLLLNILSDISYAGRSTH